MPASLPCPNPACSHLFTPQAMRGVHTLVCPRCGHSFALTTTAQPAPQPAPTARPVAPVARPAGAPAAPPMARPAAAPQSVVRPQAAPLAIPVAAPVAQPGQIAAAPPLAQAVPVAAPAPARPAPAPVAAPVDFEMPLAAERPATPANYSEAMEFDSRRGETVSLRRGRSANPPRWWIPPLVVGLITLVIGVAFTYLYFWREAYVPPDIKAPDTLFIDYNFTLSAPSQKDGWKQDTDLQKEWMLAPPGGVLLWTRNQPTSYMAVYYRDYPTRLPPTSELLDTILAKLHEYFDKMIWEPRAPASLGNLETNYTLGNQPALIFEFHGDFDTVPYVGECVILGYRGFVYWIVTCAPEEQKQQVAGDWEQLRSSFKVSNKREGWVPKARQSRPIRGTGYTLTCATDLWRDLNTEMPDPATKAMLSGFDYSKPGEKFHAGKAALLQVFELGKEEDLEKATKAARMHLDEQLKGEGLGELVLQELDNKEAPIGNTAGQLVRLRLKTPGSNFDRFIMMAVVPLGDQLVVIRGECPWKRRDLWETELLEIFKTFKTN